MGMDLNTVMLCCQNTASSARSCGVRSPYLSKAEVDRSFDDPRNPQLLMLGIPPIWMYTKHSVAARSPTTRSNPIIRPWSMGLRGSIGSTDCSVPGCGAERVNYATRNQILAPSWGVKYSR